MLHSGNHDDLAWNSASYKMHNVMLHYANYDDLV